MFAVLHPQEQAAGKAPNFDRLARLYRWVEWLTFGRNLWHCRCTFLSLLNGCCRALVIGDGDGRFVARLLGQNAKISVEAVDSSAAMLRELERRSASHLNRLKVISADARTFKPLRADYDAIVTHFFLDCLSTEEAFNLAVVLLRHARRDAIWVVSEFQVPSQGFSRFVARLVISALYFAFRFLTGLEVRRLPDYHSALRKAGWKLEREEKRICGLLVSEQWRIDGKQDLSAEP
jgi:hypothetical protein